MKPWNPDLVGDTVVADAVGIEDGEGAFTSEESRRSDEEDDSKDGEAAIVFTTPQTVR